MRIVSEAEFRDRLLPLLPKGFDCVTGPGRSGAIAAVYASHVLGIPFVPYGAKAFGRVLIVDTATKTGRTIRKALRRYAAHDPQPLVAFFEPPRVTFWYELQLQAAA